jgi:NADH:ubiquinone oxidoreductase subunit 6 (subunit J)
VLLAGMLVGTIHYSAKAEVATATGEAIVSGRPSPELVGSVINGAPVTWRIDPARPHVDALGRTLFLDHYVSVEVIGVLLLTAVVGAMLIVNHRMEPKP